jgi:hypothetical protein
MIRATCICGKRVKADPKHAGKTIACPKCGMPLVLPFEETPPAPAEAEANPFDFTEPPPPSPTVAEDVPTPVEPLREPTRQKEPAPRIGYGGSALALAASFAGTFLGSLLGGLGGLVIGWYWMKADLERMDDAIGANPIAVVFLPIAALMHVLIILVLMALAGVLAGTGLGLLGGLGAFYPLRRRHGVSADQPGLPSWLVLLLIVLLAVFGPGLFLGLAVLIQQAVAPINEAVGAWLP